MGEFSIYGNNLDTTAFGLRMNAALTNPSYFDDYIIWDENLKLKSSLAATYNTNPLENIPIINQPLIDLGRDSNAFEFGSTLGSTMFAPGMYTDSIHWNFDIGLDNPFSGPNNQAYINAMLNNTKWDFTIPNFGGLNLGNLGDFGNLGTLGNLGNLNGLGGFKDNSDKIKFDKKASLLEKIDSANKEKIEKIRTEIGNDYKKGIEKLDELLKTVDNTKIQKAVADTYKEEHKSKLDSAKTISNKWINSTSAKVDTTSLTTDNVLDVLGTYITNTNYTGEDGFKTLIENNEKIVDVLLEKAESMKDSFKPEYWEKEIVPRINVVKQNKTKHDKVFGLFNQLRNVQTLTDDRKASNQYDLPSDKKVTVDVAHKEYEAELKKYNETLFNKQKK